VSIEIGLVFCFISISTLEKF